MCAWYGVDAMLSEVVEVEFTPHAGQWDVINSDARFRVVACGRRWGKTMLSGALILQHATENARSLCMWVAPVYSQTDIAFRMLVDHLPPDVAVVNRSEKSITLNNGSRILCKSADQPQNLRGFGVDFMVVDEAAFVKEDAWTGALRPTLSDTDGRALLISTFNGMNWFYKAFDMGRSTGNPEWASWRYTTLDNPYIKPSEVDEAKRSLPEAVFAQEFLASPISMQGAVFPGNKVEDAIQRGVHAHTVPGLSTYAGLDWGYAAATAFEVCQEDVEGRIHWFDERTWVATQLDTRVDAVVELARKYRIEAIYADAAGASENAKLLAALQEARLSTHLVRVPFGKRLNRGETAKDAGIKARRWYLENDLESLGPEVMELIRTTRGYHYKENSEDVAKVDDHQVDAATAFYASRRNKVTEER